MKISNHNWGLVTVVHFQLKEEFWVSRNVHLLEVNLTQRTNDIRSWLNGEVFIKIELYYQLIQLDVNGANEQSLFLTFFSGGAAPVELTP